MVMLEKAAQLCFPEIAVDLLAARLEDVNPESEPGANDGVRVVLRPIRPTDDSETIGVFGYLWSPYQESKEMRGGPQEPTIQQYTIVVQGLVKNMDEELGIKTHSLMSALIRSMLYRDAPLAVGFGELSVTVNGVREHVTKYGVSNQRFLNNELKGQFVFLSRLEFLLETQIQ